jgi:hypothetical protein
MNVIHPLSFHNLPTFAPGWNDIAVRSFFALSSSFAVNRDNNK